MPSRSWWNGFCARYVRACGAYTFEWLIPGVRTQLPQAESFDIYERFCPGHPAAMDLVRRAQDRWPAVWDAYEQRCALLTSHSSAVFSSDDHDMSSPTSTGSEVDDGATAELSSSQHRRRRRHSTPVLSFMLPSSSPETSPTDQLPFSLPSPASTVTENSRQRAGIQKLKFADYLIKPVQRICKYPLLLDQLQDKRRRHATSGDSTSEDANNCDTATDASNITSEAIGKAAQTMRDIVSRVNRASEKEAHNLRSALIASKISFSHGPLSSAAVPTFTNSPTVSTPPSSECASSNETGHSYGSSCACSTVSTAPTSPCSSCSPTILAPRPTSLTAEFVSSLGPCLLAGALDVVQYPAHRAKYLGVFLYAGGYCILAKVTKGGRVYEPRHWFALHEVDVVDVEEDFGTCQLGHLPQSWSQPSFSAVSVFFSHKRIRTCAPTRSVVHCGEGRLAGGNPQLAVH